MTDWLGDLESTCSSLGTWDGANYVKEEDCLECVKDLIRFVSFLSTLFFSLMSNAVLHLNSSVVMMTTMRSDAVWARLAWCSPTCFTSSSVTAPTTPSC